MAHEELADGQNTCLCVCICDHSSAIAQIAVEYDFTFQEAFDYVLMVGLTYTRHPPQAAQEPGE